MVFIEILKLVRPKCWNIQKSEFFIQHTKNHGKGQGCSKDCFEEKRRIKEADIIHENP